MTNHHQRENAHVIVQVYCVKVYIQIQGYETKQACDVKDADEATMRRTRPWQQAFPLFKKG